MDGDKLSMLMKPVAATAAVMVAAGLSYFQKLGMEKEMVFATTRAMIQLSFIGFLLDFIFTRRNDFWILFTYFFMVVLAGHTAGKRAKHIPKGNYIAGVSILSGTGITLFLLIILNVFPFTPRYIIPIAGMLVGNAMTVTGVTMKKLREDLKSQKNLVETALALGATPRQAILNPVKRSLGIALAPVMDNAKTVGLITLPGTMTGLILGGASPLQAIQLQIVVTNMLIGASTMSSMLCAYLCWPSFLTKAYQLESTLFLDD
ncbi:hypothetical protein J5N97_006073 [Dioscorea zingiberensis]|uniref:ABC transporter protein n=1 Tax=Dioscorea zingiberensis TaxID=325984 RepID=A0A9D5DBR7_9LILI|nr:hypothetical protein J5N97_006073 [Dioscorea zingiberensis]